MRRWVSVVLVAVVPLSGCDLLGLGGGASHARHHAPVHHHRIVPAAPAAASADNTKPYQRPEYPANERRNPFQPDLDVIAPPQKVLKGNVRPLQPLEQFALSSLSLVAIISETAVPKAMFVDPDGFGHVVKEGDRIGRNGGVISDIRDNAVEVRESNDGNAKQAQIRTIKLRQVKLVTSDNEGLSAKERKALQDLLKTKKGRQAVQQGLQQAGGGSQPPAPQTDNRFPGLAPPK